MYLLLLGFENDSGQVSRYLARYVVVSRTNSAAKRLELKIGISHVCICRRWFQGAPCIQLSSDIDGHGAGRQEILVRSIRCAGWMFLRRDWLARAWQARKSKIGPKLPPKLAGTPHLSKCFRFLLVWLFFLALG